MRYRVPITIRLFFLGLRAITLSLLIIVVAWVTFVPATADENAALGTQTGTERPVGLITMRVAKAMVHFAPKRAARMLSQASNGEISIELAELMLRDVAAGPVAQRDANTEIVQEDTTETQDAETKEPQEPTITERRQIDGAKFIQVD